MLINTETIKALNPCNNRLEHYLKSYSDFNGSVKQFIELSEITYQDKIWVLTRVLSKPVLRRWAGLCAQSTLHLFEQKYPNDNRPRLAVECALRGETNNAATYAATFAACAAAAADAADAATFAAYAATFAAYAADAATYAADAATFAAYAAAAADAADAAAVTKQQTANLSFILDAIEGVA